MQTVHKQIGILVAFGLLSLVAGTVSAQNYNVQFDEWGTGFLNGNPLPFTPSAVDPISGQATLLYTLPFNIIPGDVVLTDPGPSISDILRFENFRAPLAGSTFSRFPVVGRLPILAFQLLPPLSFPYPKYPWAHHSLRDVMVLATPLREA